MSSGNGELPEIFVKNLTFSFAPSDPNVQPSLINVCLGLPKGSRTILVGANGGTSITPYASTRI